MPQEKDKIRRGQDKEQDRKKKKLGEDRTRRGKKAKRGQNRTGQGQPEGGGGGRKSNSGVHVVHVQDQPWDSWRNQSVFRIFTSLHS